MLIRKAKVKDSVKILELEKKVWGKTGASLNMIQNRIKFFPDGGYVACEGEEVIGVVFFELISSKQKYKNWYEYTDNGSIKNSHKKNGDIIFGIDLSVNEKFSGKGIGTKLLLKVAEYAIFNNIKKGILGGRMPLYHKYSDIKPDDYIKLRDSEGRLVDPELRFYSRAGLKIKQVIPEYFEDKDSLNYGVLLEWSNPFYKIKNNFLKKLSFLLFTLGFKIEVALSR